MASRLGTIDVAPSVNQNVTVNVALKELKTAFSEVGEDLKGVNTLKLKSASLENPVTNLLATKVPEVSRMVINTSIMDDPHPKIVSIDLEPIIKALPAVYDHISITKIFVNSSDFVNPGIAQEFWTSISPTLATGGRAIITSTPNSDEDVFAQIWRESQNKYDEHGNEQEVGQNGFHGFTASWDEHPDRDEQWKQEELGRIGEERFRREYGCEFLVFDETLVNSIVLSTLEGIQPIVNMGQTRWYKKMDPQKTYVVSLDPAMGTGGDNAAIQVVELPTFEQVAEWKHNTTAIPQQIRILRDICTHIKEETQSTGSNIYWSVENNTIGESALLVINDFGEENIPGMFVSEPIRKGHIRKFRKGFNTTHRTKISACARLKSMIEKGKLKINSKPLITELKAFVASGSSYKAKTGENDDLVSAMLLAMRIVTVLKDWDPKIYTSFSQADEDTADRVYPLPLFISST